jgi:hypothetical protein
MIVKTLERRNAHQYPCNVIAPCDPQKLQEALDAGIAACAEETEHQRKLYTKEQTESMRRRGRKEGMKVNGPH